MKTKIALALTVGSLAMLTSCSSPEPTVVTHTTTTLESTQVTRGNKVIEPTTTVVHPSTVRTTTVPATTVTTTPVVRTTTTY